jgi:hypothetical protein
MARLLVKPEEDPEGQTFETKSSLDPTNVRDMLGLVADIVAMPNTSGGRIVIGTRGSMLSESHVKLFDSARLDDQVNAYSEPAVGGITSVLVDQDLLMVEVAKSKNFGIACSERGLAVGRMTRCLVRRACPVRRPFCGT